MHDFELYLQLLTQNSFCFFAQKTLFADSFIQTLFPCSPGLFFENTILVLALRHPVLMSTPHQASLRIAFLVHTHTHTHRFLTPPHTKAPTGQLDYTRSLGECGPVGTREIPGKGSRCKVNVRDELELSNLSVIFL